MHRCYVCRRPIDHPSNNPPTWRGETVHGECYRRVADLL